MRPNRYNQRAAALLRSAGVVMVITAVASCNCGLMRVDGGSLHLAAAFRHTDPGTSSGADFVAGGSSYSVARSCSACAQNMADCMHWDCNMNSPAVDCDCMDGGCNANCTSAVSGAVADSGDEMKKRVAKAVRE